MPNLRYDNDLWQKALDWRGITDPCEGCGGSGVKDYSNTATWHGGIGGQSFTKDVCDVCWGSGDKYEHWTDLRKMKAQRAAWDEQQVFEYLGQRLYVRGFKKRLIDLADFCDTQERKRKVPEGEQAFWWAHEWHALSNMLRRLVGGAP